VECVLPLGAGVVMSSIESKEMLGILVALLMLAFYFRKG
jgi:hypothetical protein